MVPKVGLEPTRLAPPPPQDGVSTNFTTSACFKAARHFRKVLRENKAIFDYLFYFPAGGTCVSGIGKGAFAFAAGTCVLMAGILDKFCNKSCFG